MPLSMRHPSVSDGSRIWSVIRRIPGLDLNSPYCYFLFADHFADTCLVAEFDGDVVGATIAYRKPAEPTTLFVWQIGVDPRMHGHGVGRAMLEHLVTTLSPTRIEASIGPENEASHALFRSVARAHDAAFDVRPWLSSADFPEAGHEAEELICIGPIPDADTDANACPRDVAREARRSIR